MGTSHSTSTERPPLLQNICQRLASNDPSLTELHLAGYDTGERIGDKGAIALADALKVNTTAKELILCSNDIGPLGATALFQALVHGTSIETLNLRSNQVGNNEGSANALSLVGKTRVKKLILTDNSINAGDAAALADSLKQNKSLKTLYLSGNPIGDGGASAFGETLKSPSLVIKSLYLTTCEIGNHGIKGLADGIENNSSIEDFGINSNKFGDEGAKYLAQKLKINHGLKELSLSNNQIGSEGLDALIREGLQHNFSLQRFFLTGIDDPCLQDEKLFYLKLNKAGRQLLRNDVHPSLWCHVLAKAKVRRDPDVIFYFLRANPQLLKRHAYINNKF